ncbi:hypothetical protein JYU34_020772 [Plutella xylostella]|uniref:Uncharacterized protein n=1 Tax=Plutella xylostella TaxID=51655 RepID=A0ABQ7PS72_PLUXY|nr:hypothetical protein JYU34_020772 [Plutella xylostella]
MALGGAAAWFVIRKRPFGKGGGLGSLASSQSVSFRQGSNVEFGGPGGEPAYTLEETRKGRDFSNPMYEAVTRAAAAGSPEPPIPGIYEVPDELKASVQSAVISPSSTETRAAAPGKRPRALDPAADTTADTAALVKEDRDC